MYIIVITSIHLILQLPSAPQPHLSTSFMSLSFVYLLVCLFALMNNHLSAMSATSMHMGVYSFTGM